MGKKIAVLLLGLIFLCVYPSMPVTAAPSPPQDVVNHATRECGQFWRGDECQDCVPAAGWEPLTGACPAGYTVLDHEAPKNCSLTASPYCCQTVNSTWSGCFTLPGYSPPIPPWVLTAGIAIAGMGLIALIAWVKTWLAGRSPGKPPGPARFAGLLSRL